MYFLLFGIDGRIIIGVFGGSARHPPQTNVVFPKHNKEILDRTLHIEISVFLFFFFAFDNRRQLSNQVKAFNCSLWQGGIYNDDVT